MIISGPKNNNKLNLFLNKYFSIFLVFLVIVILIGAYLLILRPKFQATLGVIEKNLEEQQKLYFGQQKKLVNLQAINAVYKQISAEDLKKFDNILPTDYPPEALFGELEEVIKQSGFILSNVNVNKEELLAEGEASASVGRMVINLSLGAVDYSGLKSLLKKLENNLRLLDIQDVAFSPADESLNLTMAAYYYKKK